MNLDKIKDLIQTENTLYPTLSMICQLAPLDHDQLRIEIQLKDNNFALKNTTLTYSNTDDRFMPQKHPTSSSTNTLQINIDQAIDDINKLSDLIRDLELTLTLTSKSNDIDTLSNKVIIDVAKTCIEQAIQTKNHTQLTVLTNTYKKLEDLLVKYLLTGEHTLKRQEEWIQQSMTQLLNDLSKLRTGRMRALKIEQIYLDEIFEISKWPHLLDALVRGVQDLKPSNLPDDLINKLTERVSDEVLEDVYYVFERIIWTQRDTIRDLEFDMIYCSPGDFLMGSDVPLDRSTPIHQRKITQGFLLGKFLVTQELWEEVMGYNPSSFRPPNHEDLKKDKSSESMSSPDQLNQLKDFDEESLSVNYNATIPSEMPIENISWLDCVLFCNRLSEIAGLDKVYEIIDMQYANVINHNSSYYYSPPERLVEVKINLKADGYRLPTEAEWEYAAKAGTSFKYAGSDILHKVSSHNYEIIRGPFPVGMKQSNKWGFYDMTGNLGEWSNDDASNSYSDDEIHSIDFEDKVSYSFYKSVRGGDWDYYRDDIYSITCRSSSMIGCKSTQVGLRLARSYRHT